MKLKCHLLSFTCPIQYLSIQALYLSIVEPHMSYWCSVSGCCGDTKLNILQKLQNRAVRIVTNSPFDSSIVPLLQRLGWLPVDRLVHRETSTMVYKSLKRLAPDNLCQIFSLLSDVHNRVLWNTKSNLVIQVMIKSHLLSAELMHETNSILTLS